jgi:hypothetical protein
MENVKNYEEFNEGLANKLATATLMGALALTAPSCMPKGEVKTEQERKN